jgi:hypothetical protein
MEPFEYVMVLVSIVIGLAIAHILSALGSAVHRLRGHGPPIRLEPVFLLWVSYVFIWLVSFWWWEFKFQDLDVEWTFGLYLFIFSYAIWLFALTVVLVPEDMEGMRDSFVYFVEGRRWFFGAVLIGVGLDIADTFVKGFEWGVRPVFWVQTAVFVAACIIGMSTTRRSVHLATAAVAVGAQIVYMFRELGILGSW